MWTTKLTRLLEISFVHYVKTKNLFTFQLKRPLVFASVETAKPSCHMFNIPFKEQKSNWIFSMEMADFALQ